MSLSTDLNFPASDADETMQVRVVLIADDIHEERVETFTVKIRDQRGIQLGDRSEATVSIIDRDSMYCSRPFSALQIMM